MAQPKSIYLLEDPSRLAALTPEQRTIVARRLEAVTILIDALVADIDLWLPRPAPVPEPVLAPAPAIPPCAWCAGPSTATAHRVVLGIDLGFQASCLGHDHH